MIRLGVTAALCLVLSLLRGSVDRNTTAYAGQLSNGLNSPGLSSGLNGPGLDAGGSGGNPPPVDTCTGAADFSNGCEIALFGH